MFQPDPDVHRLLSVERAERLRADAESIGPVGAGRFAGGSRRSTLFRDPSALDRERRYLMTTATDTGFSDHLDRGGRARERGRRRAPARRGCAPSSASAPSASTPSVPLRPGRQSCPSTTRPVPGPTGTRSSTSCSPATPSSRRAARRWTHRRARPSSCGDPAVRARRGREGGRDDRRRRRRPPGRGVPRHAGRGDARLLRALQREGLRGRARGRAGRPAHVPRATGSRSTTSRAWRLSSASPDDALDASRRGDRGRSEAAGERADRRGLRLAPRRRALRRS